MNIVLTGFMAAGKTSVGRALAKKLDMKFVDTDELIEKKAGMKIKDIFHTHGEQKFRDMESKIIAAVAKKNGYVISTGGGAVLRRSNVNVLRRGGIIVNLKTSRDVILSRVTKIKSRPLLDPEKVKNTEKEIKKILDYRKPFYAGCDFAVSTDKTTPAEAADRIISLLEVK